MKLPLALQRHRAEIDAEMRSVLAGQELPLYDMMRYHLGWVDEHGRPLESSAGKALRPALCLLACEAAGGGYSRALPAAVAVELTHNFSLIHDDIQDGDRERRHRPTVWSIWGQPQAINAGTAMRLLASLALLRLGDHGIPAEKQLHAQRLLDQHCLTMIEGQYLDISYESRLDVSVADYLEMVRRKTAALMGCSLQLGALLSTDDELAIEAFARLGSNLGMAFQIRDDVLGIQGAESETGKPLGSDIRRRKKSLPVVYALEMAEGEAREALLHIYGKEAVGDDDLETVLRILDILDALPYAQRTAGQYCATALQEINGLALLPSLRQDLEEVAHFLVQRRF